MGFGALIIGDEIMRGKRQDRHFQKLIELLRVRGLHLDWARYVGDEPRRLVDTLRQTMASGDTVFSFGGIGATPDDRTRQSAAEAAGVALALHPEAAAELHARFGDQITPNRLQLGEFPVSSRIIPNPFNQVPGFSYADHHFVPGFPQMAWPMIEWVLETYYRDRFHMQREAEQAIIVWEGNEGALMELMRKTERDYPEVRVFSLPSFGDENTRRHVELGVRGNPEQVEQAMAEIKNEVVSMGFSFELPSD